MSATKRKGENVKEMEGIRPKIVAFCCNWCAYAGADLAGVSRMQYPANVEIIRTMCSGRIDPAFILRAFEMGADGVLVAGCHEADCHYISGNQHARKRVESTRELLDLLGLGAERLMLKWINANEGGVFAETITKFTEKLKGMKNTPFQNVRERKNLSEVDFQQLVKNTGVYNCLECGKCTASCPVARRDPNFSPRRTIEKALENLVDEIETDRLLWSCLTCKMCEQRCPSGVQYCEFVQGARAEARRINQTGKISHSGVNLAIQRMHGVQDLQQNRLGIIDNKLKVKKKADSKEDFLYFVGCAPYYQILYSELDLKVGEIPNHTVALLNRVGIQPVILANERCCGHDLLWNGDIDSFAQLVGMNLKEFKKAGASKIVTSCPECYRTLRLDYPKFGRFDLEVKHISEVLAERAGKLKFKSNGEKVTLQDPCRLGRHLGVFKPPRDLLEAAGAELVEMEHHGPDSTCCGVAAWVNCGMCSKSMQLQRLREARITGARKIITPCLKCSIHLTCAQTGELPIPREEVEMEVVDFTRYLAEAAGIISPNGGGEG